VSMTKSPFSMVNDIFLMADCVPPGYVYVRSRASIMGKLLSPHYLANEEPII